jgi:potassium efflux system protein
MTLLPSPLLKSFYTYLYCLLLFVALCFSGPSAAETINPVKTATPLLADARVKIDEIRNRLHDDNEDTELADWRKKALDIQSQANVLAELLEPKLSDVTARLTELGSAPEETQEAKDVAARRAQLLEDSSQLDAQLKLARLLSVEAAQIAEQISTLRRSHFQAQLGERRSSILSGSFWKDLKTDSPRDWQRLLNLAKGISASATQTPINVWAALIGGMIAAALLHIACGQLFVRLTAKRVPSGRLRRSFLAFCVVILNIVTPTIIFTLLYIGLSWSNGLADGTKALLLSLITTVCFAGCAAGLGRALLAPGRPSWRLPSISNSVAYGMRWVPAALGAIIVLIWLADSLPILIDASLTTTIFATSLAALVFLAALAWTLSRWRRLSKSVVQEDGSTKSANRPMWVTVLSRIIWIAIACSTISILAGYVAFGSFIAKQILWFVVIFCATYLLCILIADGFNALLTSPSDTTEQRHQQSRAQAAVLLTGVARVIVGILAFTLLLAPFGEGPSELLHRIQLVLEGLQVGEVHLRPQALLQGIVVLAICLLAVRFIKRWLIQRYLPTTNLDPGMQTSAATLFGYAGMVLAVAMSLSALGLGLERVAWIASALSVGIGFGLQAVVQNFVSGLILLAERPVKVGDWVSLGGVEGDILRINVRATEIQMSDKSTVIVPNSEFITKTVRNVTHDDPMGLVQVKFPMPFDTDVQQVRDIMLAAFLANEGILDTPAPAVFLEGIDTGRLMFNARGYVSTPRNAYSVRSALLYSILERLNEAKIPLSTPSTMLLTTQDKEPPSEKTT